MVKKKKSTVNKAGTGFKLMKHSSKFTPHKNATLYAKFKIQNKH
jgi:hypothetical protein